MVYIELNDISLLPKFTLLLLGIILPDIYILFEISIPLTSNQFLTIMLCDISTPDTSRLFLTAKLLDTSTSLTSNIFLSK